MVRLQINPFSGETKDTELRAYGMEGFDQLFPLVLRHGVADQKKTKNL